MSAKSCILTVSVFAILLAGGFMALFISLILPEDYLASTKQTKKPDVDDKSGTIVAKIQDYPFLLSITVPIYLDVETDHIFVCSGVIINTKQFIGGYTCLYHYNQTEFKKVARVRSNSSYFTKGGTIHKITNTELTTSVPESPVFLLGTVEPEFTAEQIIVLYKGNMQNVNEFLQVGWGSNIFCSLYAKGFEDGIYVKSWYIEDNEQCKKANHKIIGEIRDKKQPQPSNGRPLITARTKELIGIHLDKCKYPTSTDKKVLFARWTETITDELYQICHPINLNK